MTIKGRKACSKQRLDNARSHIKIARQHILRNDYGASLRLIELAEIQLFKARTNLYYLNGTIIEG
jgi:hypothetical protein